MTNEFLHIPGLGSGTHGRAQVREYFKILINDPCAYCGSLQEHFDHIVPISGGGIHIWDNFTAACRRCNDEKKAKSLLHFLAERTSKV